MGIRYGACLYDDFYPCELGCSDEWCRYFSDDEENEKDEDEYEDYEEDEE